MFKRQMNLSLLWVVCSTGLRTLDLTEGFMLPDLMMTNNVTSWTLGWRKDIFVSKTLQQALPQPPAAFRRPLCKCLLTMKLDSFTTGDWDHSHQEGDYQSKEKHGQARMNSVHCTLSQLERWTCKHLQLVTLLSKLWYNLYSRHWVMSMHTLQIILNELRSRHTSLYTCFDHATYSRLSTLCSPPIFLIPMKSKLLTYLLPARSDDEIGEYKEP